MDDYLKSFIDYLEKKVGNQLAGVIIYGSYVKGYFDPQKSDYDVFVLFKKKVIDLQEEIKLKFPKISLQIYVNLEEFKNKILGGGWNTYITFIYTGKILYETEDLVKLKKIIADYRPDFRNLDNNKIIALLEKLKADTRESYKRNHYELNKFLYSSLLRKFQILYYIRNSEIMLEFSKLLSLFKDKCILDNLEWLSLIETQVFERREELLIAKESYIAVLEKVDELIQKELVSGSNFGPYPASFIL